jgi:ppGpp synthetase/RelA/SpoT-type nucleotidyltranferase
MSSQFKRQPLDIQTMEKFCAHAWIVDLQHDYDRDATLAKHALAQLTSDLSEHNTQYNLKNGRVAFTTIEGRVKNRGSFFQKLWKLCRANASKGLSQREVTNLYSSIKDLCGVRFSCPYYDEILPTVSALRTRLEELGYATDLRTKGCKDRNNLDEGDESGYRSYHFYVEVPTPINIYGEEKFCLCEIQARSELQHVWAVKSHDLLYKPGQGWTFGDAHVAEDMRQVSNSLRAADQHMISIRDRIRKA